MLDIGLLHCPARPSSWKSAVRRIPSDKHSLVDCTWLLNRPAPGLDLLSLESLHQTKKALNMSTPGARAGVETFDSLNLDYEKAYHTTPYKIACIKKAISLINPNSRVLDVGCGTGIPVSDILSQAGLTVVGFDISPKMVELAQKRVPGEFSVSDMLQFQAQGTFAGVFIIFATLQLSYADFHAAVYKFANVLQPGGILALGQMPGDNYVKDETHWDETKTYVEDYDAPFMGEPLPTFMLSAQGQRDFLTSMGLEIVSETIDAFQPDHPKCDSEDQQYIIARRPTVESLAAPRPLPRTGNVTN